MKLVVLSLIGCIHSGTYFLRVKSLLLLSLTIAPLTMILNSLSGWYIDNEMYVTIVLGAIIADHLIGTIYHAFWLKDFSIKKNVLGLTLKIFLVVMIGFLFEGLNILIVHDNIIKDWVIVVLRLMVFLYPGGSAFANSYVMTGKKFPPVGFMNKLEEFSKNASINITDKGKT